jgi:hypothetical protein
MKTQLPSADKMTEIPSEMGYRVKKTIKNVFRDKIIEITWRWAQK